MKATKITYWITTAVVALMMAYSCYAYLTQDVIKQAFQHLGFPDYFRVELGIAKLIGAALLIAPVAKRLKEWAYAGIFFVMTGASVSHIAINDSLFHILVPSVIACLAICSWYLRPLSRRLTI